MAEIDTTPYWQTSATLPAFGPLDRDLTVDVVVVGGGLTGLTAAYLLTRAGRRVALLERGRCASIDTGHTTAHLTCVTDTRLSELLSAFGEDHARAVWDAGLSAIARIDEHIRTERIQCNFAWVPGYLHAPHGANADAETQRRALDDMRREADTASSLGFDARFVERVPLMQTPGVRFENQARFHPRAYLAGLAARVESQDRSIYEQTSVDEVTDDEPLTVKANGRRIRADYLIVATHNPIIGNTNLLSATLLQTKLALYTSYVVAGRVPSGRVPDALFWDTDDPYRYMRIDRRDDADYVIYGGEDHKTGQEADTTAPYATLERALSTLLPDIAITHRWSGQVIESPDGLPFLGEITPRQFIATAVAGNGMTFGTLGAMMACDAVLERPNPWRELFDVHRAGLKHGVWDYIKENRDYPYYMIRDRFAGPDGKSLREIPRGEGRLIDIDGQRVAAYRHEDGSISARSAVCTHMGCMVQWNPAERSWDCPCHGSRFGVDGSVISGPAESPLSESKSRPTNRRAAGGR